MQIIRWIDRALDWARTLCITLSSVALVVLVVIFAWLVFGRYVLNETPTWVEQVALVLICYIAFFAAAAGVRDDTHLGVTFLRDALPAKLRDALRVVADLIMAGFGLVMLIYCAQLAMFGWDTMLPMLNLPEGVRTLPAAICGGLIFAFSLARAVTRVHTLWTSPADKEG